jgi:hypothetical protein
MTAQELVRTDAGDLVDLETGEVIKSIHADARDILFGHLVPPDISQPLDKTQTRALEDCVDAAVEKIANQAARAQAYRDQAEKKAKPIDRRVSRYMELLKPWACKLAEMTLPRFKTPQKSGAKAGDFSRKTVDLSRASLKFTKTGGSYAYDERALLTWLESEPALRGFYEKRVKNIVELEVDIEKLLERIEKDEYWKSSAPEITRIEADDFAKMSLVLPKSDE